MAHHWQIVKSAIFFCTAKTPMSYHPTQSLKAVAGSHKKYIKTINKEQRRLHLAARAGQEGTPHGSIECTHEQRNIHNIVIKIISQDKRLERVEGDSMPSTTGR